MEDPFAKLYHPHELPQRASPHPTASRHDSSSRFMNAVRSLVLAHEHELRTLQEENAELRKQLQDNAAEDGHPATGFSAVEEGVKESLASKMAMLRNNTPSDIEDVLREPRRGSSLTVRRSALPRASRCYVDRSTLGIMRNQGQRDTNFSNGSVATERTCRDSTGADGCHERPARVNTARFYTPKSPWNKVMASHSKRTSLVGRVLSIGSQAEAIRKSQQSLIDKNCVTDDSWFQPYVLHPNSAKRITWDLLGAVLLLYDVVAIPFINAFDTRTDGFIEVMTIGSLFFWFVDMFMSMFTGYQSGRHLVMSPFCTFSRYLRTWAVFDISILSMDVLLLNTDNGSFGSMFRAFRALRFVRAARLVRLVKFRKILQHLQDKIKTEASSICFGVFMIVICLVFANHVVACCWYEVGNWASEDNPDENTWVSEHDMLSMSVMYRYTTALHWSLTQFTPASMEVTPTNVRERTFAVIVLLFAMLTFSSFVSTLTASIAQLRNLRNDEARQFWMLKRYLRDWGVSVPLAVKIQHYCEFAYEASHRRVQEKDVALLALLSPQMSSELKHETFSVHLRVHSFFAYCGNDARYFSKALASLNVARDEWIFHCGMQGHEVLFLTHGCLQYVPGATMDEISASLEEDDMFDYSIQRQTVNVVEGDWVAEPVLWTHWAHVGDLNSLVECQLITVDAEVFGACFANISPVQRFARDYAIAFVGRLNDMDDDLLSDLTYDTIDPKPLAVLAGAPSPKKFEETPDASSRAAGVLGTAAGFVRRASCQRRSAGSAVAPEP